MRRLTAMILSGMVLATAGTVVAGQDGGSAEPRPAPPEFLFAPRPRPGFVPIRVTLPGPAFAAPGSRVRLDPDDDAAAVQPTLATPTVPPVPGEPPRAAIGYLWGQSQPWGYGHPATNARCVTADGAASADVHQPMATGPQVAALLPRDGRLPADIALPAFGKLRAALSRVGPGRLPDHVVGWDPVDVLLLSSAAPLDELAVEERTALVQWVVLGGIVGVLGAPPATTFAHPLLRELLGPFVPATTPLQVSPPAASDERPVAALASAVGAVVCLPGLPPDATACETWGEAVVLAHRAVGHGHVFYVACDPSGFPSRAAADLGPLLTTMLTTAREAQIRRPGALGARWPGLPAGAAWALELDGAGARDNFNGAWGQGGGSNLETAASRLHIGRARLPSPLAITLFLACYLAALGPGVWWVRRRFGGGLVGLPAMAGAALLFTALAFVVGLATRGVACTTRRLTLLWPVPGRPEAAEQTVLAVYGGMGHTTDVVLPGHVAPLPLSTDGRPGGGFTCDAAPGNPGIVRDLRVGLWETRLLLAEGVRMLGGPVTAESSGAGATIRITNRSGLALGPGAVFRGSPQGFVAVPSVAAGAAVSVEREGAADGDVESLIPRLGLGHIPNSWEFAGLFANAITNIGPRQPTWDRATRRNVGPRAGAAVYPGLVYLAPVDPAALPGGGPVVAGARSEMDVVLVVVPLTDGGGGR